MNSDEPLTPEKIERLRTGVERLADLRLVLKVLHAVGEAMIDIDLDALIEHVEQTFEKTLETPGARELLGFELEVVQMQIEVMKAARPLLLALRDANRRRRSDGRS